LHICTILMRCSILVISLAIIYASASPTSDSVVPEDSLYALDDDLSEAQQTIDDMTASGKSDKDCRKLVTDTRKEVTDNVDFCNKAMNDLPKGESCPAQGQENVKLATEAKTKADKHVVYCKTQVTKAEQTQVDFGSATFSTLIEGKCSSFYSSTSYTTAKSSHKTAVEAHTRAVGAAEQAAKSLKLAIEAAAKAKKECECKVKSDHESTFAKHSASNAANQKAWNFACKVECVLDGKTTCTCSAAPMCKRPKVTAAVMEAVCIAKKCASPGDICKGIATCSAGCPCPKCLPKGPCPAGYKQVGTKTKNNDVSGACLGQSFGNTMSQCEAKCKANKKCTSFMYGKPAQNFHGAGLCELCDRDPNNSWGKDLVFCKRA